MVTDGQAFKLAPKFGFSYDIVAGCMVTTPMANGIDAYNSVTTKYLNDKLGNDWKKKFDYSFSMFQIPTLVVDFLIRKNTDSLK